MRKWMELIPFFFLVVDLGLGLRFPTNGNVSYTVKTGGGALNFHL